MRKEERCECVCVRKRERERERERVEIYKCTKDNSKRKQEEEEMVLGHDSALTRLYWARDNLRRRRTRSSKQKQNLVMT